ncbi:MAG: hypothetical protein M3354_08860 [Chloroflexota bacterium]|nr:hypothetical protein [Chloroflexota bacterium]
MEQATLPRGGERRLLATEAALGARVRNAFAGADTNQVSRELGHDAGHVEHASPNRVGWGVLAVAGTEPNPQSGQLIGITVPPGSERPRRMTDDCPLAVGFPAPASQIMSRSRIDPRDGAHLAVGGRAAYSGR